MAASAIRTTSGVFALLPTLTVNGSFMREFVSADAPCLSMIEEGNRQCGFLALRPDRPIPPEISDDGFRFGHTLPSNATFEAVSYTHLDVYKRQIVHSSLYSA